MVGSLGTSALYARLKLFVKQRLIPLKEGVNGVAGPQLEGVA